MKVALIGFASSGKSTLYRAAAKGQAKGDVTAVAVPDNRFDTIVEQVKPKKVTPATVILQDNVESAQGTGSKMFSAAAVEAAKKSDLLLHVVRGFESPIAPYYGEVEPVRDRVRIDEELVLADLQIVETRLERLSKSQTAKNPGHPEYVERITLEKLKSELEEGGRIGTDGYTEDEATIIRNYQFLTAKPTVIAFNVGEDHVAEPPDAIKQDIAKLAATGVQAFAVCATIEEEIAQLEADDQPEFLASLGLTEPASAKVIQAVYAALGLITFFTAGENETRAWPLQKGANALKAAGTIHTDIAKGFIRAEVVHYDEYRTAGSLDAAYSAGKMSLEGKEYVIQDGDLLHIRNKS
ncbi:MAG: Ribosome-binding ATPase YchF [Fimbriimonadaceae bacterium]|nr:Ribosome-binding ATPase YchF [Fimbriimonadaceae bacterium]